jgi:hypothetical protein
MASQQFIANYSRTRFPGNFPTTYPRALSIEGTTVDDPSAAFFITAIPTDGNTTSGATQHDSTSWALTVHRSRYERLCLKAKDLKDGICDPCFMTIFYDYLGDESDDACIACDVEIGDDAPLPAAASLAKIVVSSRQAADTSEHILHELKQLKDLAERALQHLAKRNDWSDHNHAPPVYPPLGSAAHEPVSKPR